MSNQLKNNLNAIELSENDLDNVVGGNNIGHISDVGVGGNGLPGGDAQDPKMVQMLQLTQKMLEAIGKLLPR
jgi:bacteriocin-like protein